eukprot:3935376-Rhodomonas_salina.1
MPFLEESTNSIVEGNNSSSCAMTPAQPAFCAKKAKLCDEMEEAATPSPGAHTVTDATMMDHEERRTQSAPTAGQEAAQPGSLFPKEVERESIHRRYLARKNNRNTSRKIHSSMEVEGTAEYVEFNLPATASLRRDYNSVLGERCLSL